MKCKEILAVLENRNSISKQLAHQI